MPKRVSLRDIEANDVAPRTPPATAPTPAAPQDNPPAPARTVDAAPKPTAKRSAARSSETALLGIYMRPELYADAKAAFVADFDNRDDAEDAFQRWVSRAIRELASKTPTARAKATAAADEYAGDGPGRSWTFPVFVDDIDLMDDAIGEDRRAGLEMRARSRFTVDALRVAVAEARRRAGGTLPTPPARLPRKLR